jgi:hypothetical protein
MRKVEKCLCIVILLSISILCIGCRGATDANNTTTVTPTQASALGEHTRNPHIRGTIVDVFTPEGSITGFYIEGIVESDTTVDKARVGITEATRIYLQTASGYEDATPEQLTVGLKVEVLFTGTILESYPPQAKAGEILIIP